jgi:hypothetical protein
MAEQTSQQTTRLFYEQFWRGDREAAIVNSLTRLAAIFERNLTVSMGELYIAALADLSPTEIIQAFTRATEQAKFFPVPAILREYAGHGDDAIDLEAKNALVYMLKGMRTEHGTRLQALQGPVLRVIDEIRDGERYKEEIRGEKVPFVLSQRVEDALRVLGWGSGTKGIALIATHPAVSEGWNFDDDQYRNQPFRAADDILRRWTEAYWEVVRCQSPIELD